MERGKSLALQRVEPMTPEQYHRVNQLFHDALEQAPEDRNDFLKEACGGDEPLRLEVGRMLAAYEQAGSFLNAPAFDALDHSLIDQQSGSLIGCVIGHYRILSKLGAGGMAEVFLAQDARLERRVALKVLPVEFTSDRGRLRRFKQEARAASALNHPNIVTIHEIGHAKLGTRDLHFIAQEFIEGQTLRRRIEAGALPLLDALDVALQAANALQSPHAAGIAHRDIKPENIMLRPDGLIKILDFGLAKLLETNAAQSELPTVDSAIPNETAPGVVLGTVAYMSPEQARGLKVDARSDIWSLGVVLHEMIAGQSPFKGATMADIIVSIIEREPSPLSQSAPGTPPELERIVTKALAKNRDERYQTAEDLAIDLKSLKRRLEFDAELSRSSRPAAAVASRVSKPSPRALLIAAIPLLVSVIGFFAWSSLSTMPPEPERQITYWLTVQKMRDGKEYEEPFESAGQEIFESGWKFRLNGVGPQTGYFYLLNEVPASGGAIGYSLLFPSPSINNGSARMSARQPIQTGWYLLSGGDGTERLWLVWAEQAVSELEAVKGAVNPKDKGVINDQNQLHAIRELLNKHSQVEPEVKTEKINKQTDVKVRSGLLVHPVELRRR
jgi:serine/threonine protein kinase